MDAPTRKWQMRRLAAGRYICWSNDLQRLWMFHTHEDGAFYGLDVGYETRTFWRAVYVPADLAEAAVEQVMEHPATAWDAPWVEAAWMLPTRKAAIEAALRMPMGVA